MVMLGVHSADGSVVLSQNLSVARSAYTYSVLMNPSESIERKLSGFEA